MASYARSMAYALVGVLGTPSFSATGGNSTPSYGQSPTATNLLVAWVAVTIGSGSSAVLPPTPSGWTLLTPDSVNTNASVAVYARIATGGDAAPVFTGTTGLRTTAQLGEFSGNPSSLASIVDQSATAVGATASVTTAALAADAASGELILFSDAIDFAVATVRTLTATLNNATAHQTDNGSTSTGAHYLFGYGITTTNSTADSGTFTTSGTAPVQQAAVLLSLLLSIPAKTGIAAVTLGAVTTTTIGIVKRIGVSAVAMGTVATTATGVVTRIGTAHVASGTVAVTTTGHVTRVGTAAVSLGSVNITGTGTVFHLVIGTAATSLGGVTLTVIGTVRHPVVGIAALPVGKVTITATGTRIAPHTGISVVSIGHMALSALGTVILPNVVQQQTVDLDWAAGSFGYITLDNAPIAGNTLLLFVASDLNPTIYDIEQVGVTWTQEVQLLDNVNEYDNEIWIGEVGSGASETIRIAATGVSTLTYSGCIQELSGIGGVDVTGTFFDLSDTTANDPSEPGFVVLFPGYVDDYVFFGSQLGDDVVAGPTSGYTDVPCGTVWTFGTNAASTNVNGSDAQTTSWTMASTTISYIVAIALYKTGAAPAPPPLTVTMSAQSGLSIWFQPPPSRLGVLMILQGGPLDGELQVVENLPTTPGAKMLFNVPHYQTFDPSAPGDDVVLSQGLQATYALSRPGPAPGPDDRWSASWIFDFTGEAYIPPPAVLPPPGPQPPVQLTQIWMSATTSLVPDTLPIVTSPTVPLVAEGTMDIDGAVTPTKAGVVSMSAVSVMSVTPDWTPQVPLIAQSSMEVDPS